ncbi:IS1595 family transposase [Oceanibaculum indicum]|uniref:Transposase-like zinc ribbon protein n=1 Tax=Oceanibaculum indicum TaxID=526216 RepID=A0A420WMX3_9PROT|nr:IS1595 family transposase [Oceanibaculum indicum]RKQ72246.1 transposase-like zinc ribbon protein [Oceanibaculum indicum]
MSVLSQPYFHDEASAFAKLEEILWSDGIVCPHCGTVGKAYEIKGKTTRIGLKKCGACRKQFTVKVGTVFESSHVPLHKWFQAVFLMASSKKGISAHQLHRTLEVTYKTAWFMAHRIREAMRTMGMEPMGGEGGVVEVDETFIGREPGKPKKRAYHHKMKVLTLVDRDSGSARSIVVDDLKPATIAPILRENMAREARLATDEAGHYLRIGKEFAAHGVVRHGREEYVVGEVHTNTIEGYFSIFKRGMKGVYQHCAKKHLHRYLAEFDFRYNYREANGVGDQSRVLKVLEGVVGKRLKYQTPCI